MTCTCRGQRWYFQVHFMCGVFTALKTLCSPYTSTFVSLEQSQFQLPLVSLCLQVFDPELICSTFWATYSNILVGRSPWTEEPGLQRVEQDRSNLAQAHRAPLVQVQRAWSKDCPRTWRPCSRTSVGKSRPTLVAGESLSTCSPRGSSVPPPPRTHAPL